MVDREGIFVDLIRRIKVENIKGKQVSEIYFTNFVANQPNIVVAPNGFGKSTIATAFKYAESGKMKVNTKDLFNQDVNNHPKLEVELTGNHAGTYISTDTVGGIANNMSVFVIKSPLYAKSTTRRIGPSTTRSAELRVEDIVVYSRIPYNYELCYTYRDFVRQFGNRSKLFLNISQMLSNCTNIKKLLEIKGAIKKCIEQSRIQASFTEFLNRCPETGTAQEIKNRILLPEIENLRQNENIAILFDCIIDMVNKPTNWQPVDVVFTAIQLCQIISYHYSNGERDILKKVFEYLDYKETRNLIDERLAAFDTTGRNIRTHETQNKLVVTFERAEAMPNGERDILSFIVNLTKFEKIFSKEVGILIVDEVFDYLDGSNMLAIQYYLIELINACKNKNKFLFPIIFTHLDPAVFSNYYFNKKKIHYISSHAPIELDSDIVKMLRLRDSKTLSQSELDELGQFYLHYTDENHSITPELAAKFSESFSDSSETFRNKLYNEITCKYLNDTTYNPIMVIAGLRIKIEELLFYQLVPEDRAEFISTHKAINKFHYVEDKGIDVPEVYYLLQPLYNDGMHMRGNDDNIRAIIKSCYLKTNNLHIRRMIHGIFV